MTKVATRPIAACRSDTARRFSANAKAINSNAKMPSADCKRSMMSPKPPMIMAAPALQTQCREMT
ncbi:hypothetical protein ABIF75_001727 [Bradyrhizobium japonicum]